MSRPTIDPAAVTAIARFAAIDDERTRRAAIEAWLTPQPRPLAAVIAKRLGRSRLFRH